LFNINPMPSKTSHQGTGTIVAKGKKKQCQRCRNNAVSDAA